MSPKKRPGDTLIGKLREVAYEVAKLPGEVSARRAKKLREQLGEIVRQLEQTVVSLDPVRDPSVVFDPSDPRVVGRFIGLGLIAQDRSPLEEIKPFYGSGVYAIYYDGPFGPYQPLAGTENPIYVGKADPAHAGAKTPREQEQRLYRRLQDHVKNIRKAEAHESATIELSDFTCRYLVIQSGWQTPAEDYLIKIFRPIWNKETKIFYGIGKHGDSPTTRSNKRSPWDTMHPGRDWAHRDSSIPDAKSSGEIIEELVAHFKKHQPYKTVDDILRKFFDDLKQGH
jgi:hypothetical protein